MKKPIVFILTALFLASGAAVAGDRGAHWGERHHHQHGRHHHHHHRHVPSYSYYYYQPAPIYYPAPRYYVPQYYGPGYNAYFQTPDYGFRFGFSGTWNDR